jgi:hypothetical protein
VLITGIVTSNRFIAKVSNGVKSAVLYVLVLACVMGIDMGTRWGRSYRKIYRKCFLSCNTVYRKHIKSVRVMDTHSCCVL